MKDMQDLMKPEEVAKKLGLSLATVYSMTHRGVIPSVKIGKSLRIQPEALAKFLEGQQKKSYDKK